MLKDTVLLHTHTPTYKHTHTHTHRDQPGDVHGSRGWCVYYAQGHVAAPCRHTVKYITEEEADDRRRWWRRPNVKTHNQPPLTLSLSHHTRVQANAWSSRCTSPHTGDVQGRQCTFLRAQQPGPGQAERHPLSPVTTMHTQSPSHMMHVIRDVIVRARNLLQHTSPSRFPLMLRPRQLVHSPPPHPSTDSSPLQPGQTRQLSTLSVSCNVCACASANCAVHVCVCKNKTNFPRYRVDVGTLLRAGQPVRKLPKAPAPSPSSPPRGAALRAAARAVTRAAAAVHTSAPAWRG